MAFSDMITTDLDVFFNTSEFAQSVTYAGATITAIVDYGKTFSHAGSVVNGAMLTVKVSDVAAPDYYDAITINGVSWKVFQEESTEIKGDGHVWEIPIYRNERPMI
jgi:hypothetical protein